MQQTEAQPSLVDNRSGDMQGRVRFLDDHIAAPQDAHPFNATPLAAVSGLLPSQVFQRTMWQRRFTARLRITDTVVVCAAVALAQSVRFGPMVPPPSDFNYYVPAFSIGFIIVWLSALATFHTRSPRLIGTGIEEYRRVIAASFWTFAAIAIATLLLNVDIARGYLAVALPGGTLALVLSRRMWRGHLSRMRTRGSYQTAVLVVGEHGAAELLATELCRNAADGFEVVGIGIPGYGPPRGEHVTIDGRTVPVVGGEAQLSEAIHSCGADTVAIAGTEHFGVLGIRRLIWDLEPMGVDLVVSTGAMDVALSRLVMRPIAGLPLLHIEKPQYIGAKRFQKRAFDFCFALATLTVALPLFVLTAFVLKVTTRGPIFYSAERIGMDGRPFLMLKFRTTVHDTGKQLPNLLDENNFDDPSFKIRNAQRLTPIGRILQRFGIDALPQFINVLRQEMSVVGPRPPLRREVGAYDCEGMRRLLVRPGITGLWQVSGRADLSWNEAARLDLSYVDNWSMVGDLLIIAKTIPVVLGHPAAPARSRSPDR
jgi:exopolysaccharide biosynthesis polyprenyl glycosylphosphotransferase